jgi:hypothetical protein
MGHQHHQQNNTGARTSRSNMTDHQKQAIVLIVLSVAIFVATQLETKMNWIQKLP